MAQKSIDRPSLAIDQHPLTQIDWQVYVRGGPPKEFALLCQELCHSPFWPVSDAGTPGGRPAPQALCREDASHRRQSHTVALLGHLSPSRSCRRPAVGIWIGPPLGAPPLPQPRSGDQRSHQVLPQAGRASGSTADARHLTGQIKATIRAPS